MKRSQGFPVLLWIATLFAASCNDGSQGTDAQKNDTNFTDTRRNSGDTSQFLKTDSAKQQDLIDADAPGQ